MFIFRVVTIAGIALLSACATNVSFDEAGELRREVIHVVARIFQLPRISSGENRRATRSTLCIRRVGSTKQNAFLRKPIEGRCFDPVTIAGSCVICSPVVCNRKEDVGA